MFFCWRKIWYSASKTRIATAYHSEVVVYILIWWDALLKYVRVCKFVITSYWIFALRNQQNTYSPWTFCLTGLRSGWFVACKKQMVAQNFMVACFCFVSYFRSCKTYTFLIFFSRTPPCLGENAICICRVLACVQLGNTMYLFLLLLTVSNWITERADCLDLWFVWFNCFETRYENSRNACWLPSQCVATRLAMLCRPAITHCVCTSTVCSSLHCVHVFPPNPKQRPQWATLTLSTSFDTVLYEC